MIDRGLTSIMGIGMKYAFLFIAFLISSCAWNNTDTSVSQTKLSMSLNKKIYDATEPNDTKLKISLWDQKAWLLNSADDVLLVTDVSSGIDGRETPARKYKVLERIEEKRSNLYGRYVNKETREVVVEKAWEHQGAIPEGTEYEGILIHYWMRLTWHGIGMHVGKFEKRIRSSFGCIRVYEKAQPYIYHKTQLNTPVEVVSKSLLIEMSDQ